MAYYKRKRTTRRQTRRAPKRRTYRRSTGYVTPSQASLHVYRNPFSTVTATAKIPDGKAVRSVGMRHQKVLPIDVPTSGNLDILIYPGLAQGVMTSLDTAADVYSNGMKWVMGVLPPGDLATNINAAPVSQSSAGISYWRTVSQAVKLALVNNSDENDGWWECCRLRPNHDANEYNIVQSELKGNQRYLSIVPAFLSESAVFGAAVNSMVDQPSYKTGKLRDIHRTFFALKPHMKDHDFKFVPEQMNLAGETANFGTTGNHRAFNPGSHLGTEFVNSNIDDSYDCILLRIHGRNSSSSQTKLVMHTVTNHEYTYNLSSQLSIFQTPGHMVANFQGVRKRQADTTLVTPGRAGGGGQGMDETP